MILLQLQLFLHKKFNIIIILLVTIVYTCSVTANCPTDPESTASSLKNTIIKAKLLENTDVLTTCNSSFPQNNID